MYVISLNLYNQEVESFDSLEIQLHLNGESSEFSDFRLIADMCFPFNLEGYLMEGCTTQLNENLQNQLPESTNNGNHHIMRIPLTNIELNQGSRIRLDLRIEKANEFGDILHQNPNHLPGLADWSFRVHRTSEGSPVDFDGLNFDGSRTDGDQYFDQTENPYITIHRSGQILSGYSP
jgi:hypothetical protein